MSALSESTAFAAEVVNAMSIDDEDYFQVAAFEEHIPYEQWSRWPCRIEASTGRILDLLDEAGASGTFFILGWVAQRYPDLIRRIAAAGHEVASHGMRHVRVFRQSPEEFREDVAKSKMILEDISGQAVQGYRASTYSINDATLWALDILLDEGYRYSSSIYPVRHDIYGMPDAPRFPFYPRQKAGGDRGILEIPITTIELFNRRIPCGGGGYFRLFPVGFSRWAWSRVNRIDGQPGVLYCHPWEFDPAQPRVPGLQAKTRFRHYLNLGRMEARFKAMLAAFKWDRMDRVYAQAIKEGSGG